MAHVSWDNYIANIVNYILKKNIFIVVAFEEVKPGIRLS